MHEECVASIYLAPLQRGRHVVSLSHPEHVLRPPPPGAVWTNWSFSQRRASLLYREIMSSFTGLTLEYPEMNTLPCWQVVICATRCSIKTLSGRRRNVGTTQEKKPHWCNTISSPHRQAETLVSVENILAAAVTYFISDERRANISNMIKQKINWQQAANCWKDPKVIAHKTCRFFQHNVLLQVLWAAGEFISHLHNATLLYKIVLR